MRERILLTAQRPRRAASKPDGHAHVARNESEPLVEALRIYSARMRQQLDQIAAARFRLSYGPLHQLLADAAAAAIGSDTDILEQTADAALRTDARQHRELQAADHPALTLGNDELEVGIAIDPRERFVVRGRQRILDPLAGAAEMIVGEQRHDRGDVLATRAADGNRLCIHPRNSSLSAQTEGRDRLRLRRSSDGRPRNGGDRSRLHARHGYRQAARRPRAKPPRQRRSGWWRDGPPSDRAPHSRA